MQPIRSAVAFLTAFVLAFAFVAFAVSPPATAAPPPTGRVQITPTIDPPGERSGQAVPHGSRYKVRNADGKVVAEGGIPGSGGSSGSYQTGTVDLPPGKYTVEVYYHTPGDRHAEGTRDYRGDFDVEVRPGQTQLHQVKVEPRNPEEHLRDRLRDVDDQIDEVEDEIDELEQDIAEHRRKGEDVGEEHTDMLEDLEEDKERLEDRRGRMQRDLHRMQRDIAAKKAPVVPKGRDKKQHRQHHPKVEP